jgi:DNA primase catalytic subunit
MDEGDLDPYTTRDFTLTPRGEQYYTALLSELPPNAEKVLSDFKHRFARLPLRQLVRYVYERYPQFTDQSEIRDEILGR